MTLTISAAEREVTVTLSGRRHAVSSLCLERTRKALCLPPERLVVPVRTVLTFAVTRKRSGITCGYLYE